MPRKYTPMDVKAFYQDYSGKKVMVEYVCENLHVFSARHIPTRCPNCGGRVTGPAAVERKNSIAK